MRFNDPPTNKDTTKRLVERKDELFSRYFRGESMYSLAKELDVPPQTMKYFLNKSRYAKEKAREIFDETM